jgi:hypothetical protein
VRLSGLRDQRLGLEHLYRNGERLGPERRARADVHADKYADEHAGRHADADPDADADLRLRCPDVHADSNADRDPDVHADADDDSDVYADDDPDPDADPDGNADDDPDLMSRLTRKEAPVSFCQLLRAPARLAHPEGPMRGARRIAAILVLALVAGALPACTSSQFPDTNAAYSTVYTSISAVQSAVSTFKSLKAHGVIEDRDGSKEAKVRDAYEKFQATANLAITMLRDTSQETNAAEVARNAMLAALLVIDAFIPRRVP